MRMPKLTSAIDPNSPSFKALDAHNRALRDATLYDIGAGTNEIRRCLIGRELVGG